MSIPDRPHRLRATLGLTATTVLLPLTLLAFGLWQQGRGLDDQEVAEARRAGAAKTVALLGSRPVPTRGFDHGAVFRQGGHTYVGPLALARARDALAQRDTAASVAAARRVLPQVVIGSGAVVGILSAAALLAALGRLGRRSRDVLVRGFSLVRRLLPPVLGAQVVLLVVGFVAAVSFEAARPLLDGGFSADGAKLLGIAAIAVGASLWTAARAVLQLRRTVGLFTPDPLPIIVRAVSPAEAPGLLRVVDGLAARLGALRPDNVVVGLPGGFLSARDRGCCGRPVPCSPVPVLAVSRSGCANGCSLNVLASRQRRGNGLGEPLVPAGWHLRRATARPRAGGARASGLVRAGHTPIYRFPRIDLRQAGNLTKASR